MDTPDRAGDSGTAATLIGTPPSDTRPTGQVQLGAEDYDLHEVLGRGGMGEVLLAHEPRMQRDVALKRMRAETPSEEATARFLREAMIQARLDHPAVVPIHRLGVDAAGRPYFTMKRLVGKTLADVIAQRSATLQKQLRALVDVCNAVERAHVLGIVHRDLKPSNIMLGDYGEVYVLDWGVARVIASDTQATSTAQHIPSLGGDTETGELLGTPGYMAPEQVRGSDVGPSADVYALGSILFELLTEMPLHPRGAAALHSTLGEVETSPVTRAPGREIPPELDSVCIDALETDPTKRPSARRLGERIEAYLDGDRDLERRRQFAARMVASGRAALVAGRRADAVHLGGRALVFDPDSDEAAELVMSLVAKPPDELPVELSGDIARIEHEARRERSRRAIFPYAAPFALAPLLPLVTVASWTMLAVVYAGSGLMALMAYFNARTGKLPLAAQVAAAILMSVLFSRVYGPFALTPVLVVGIALSITAVPWLNERPLAVVATISLAVVLPFFIEQIGLFGASYAMQPSGMLSHGEIFDHSHRSIAGLFIGNLAIIILVAGYARRINADRRLADRRLLIQRWHLLQLLPPAAATRARGWLTSSR